MEERDGKGTLLFKFKAATHTSELVGN